MALSGEPVKRSQACTELKCLLTLWLMITAKPHDLFPLRVLKLGTKSTIPQIFKIVC